MHSYDYVDIVLQVDQDVAYRKLRQYMCAYYTGDSC